MISAGPHPPDEELVEQAKRSPRDDLRAFESLVLRHRERVLANCRYLTRAPDAAEDLTQEVFVKVFFGLRRFEGRSTFRTWLERVKLNHCLTFLRRRTAGRFVSVDDASLEGVPEIQVGDTAEQEYQAVSDRQRIATVLDSIPDTLRIPVILRDLDGLSYEEIADALQISLSAVKMRIKRGREMFRARYQTGASRGAERREKTEAP